MTAALDASPADRLVAALRRDLGPPATWDYVRFYPHSLALGTIDAIWSIRVQSAVVVEVVGRYVAYRRGLGAEAETDTPHDLLGTFHDLGVSGWIERIGNRQRTYASPQAPAKAVAARQAAQILDDAGVASPEDLHALVVGRSDQLHRVEAAWRAIPGETSGLTWRRLGLVTGAYELPPSPWLIRYLRDVTGEAAPAEVERLLDDAGARLGVDPMALRQAIWHWEMTFNPSPALAAGR
jgi:hypothetical protein